MAIAIRILCLGDSYTIGESVTVAERWPVQLAARLRARGLEVAEPTVIAQTGWTTDELDGAIDQVNPKGPFDIVTLLIGVNNQYRGRSAEEYRRQFRGLLNRAIDFAGGKASRVIVLSIPDWGVTPFAGDRDRAGIGRGIDEFNRINKEETRHAGARYVNITLISREAAGNPLLTADDGLHPSGEMYRRWVELVEPTTVEALK
ncbi:MAG TPA: SGNH/GDSL hydrolase family protein [Gemmatimonadales bacterium]|nr:SGNH/GDSL hydrolase family protein [Gemmatimonadales bacterium]